MIIAIDGPAASGKSTVAKAVARRLGFDYIDTGSMYRALTWKALHLKIDISDEKRLTLFAETSRIKFLRPEDDEFRIFIDEKDVTEEIRSPEVSGAVSAVSKVPGVRGEMVKKQRGFRNAGKSLVVEGRDIGTVVFPDAELKIYLTASAEERARRRHKELVEKGYEVKIEMIERDILARDRLDSTRETSPLMRAPDAVTIDTTEKSVDRVVDEIINHL
ncbi:MAG: (d)CMP kinase [Actinobacteria bacterium]|nr:(d)CMP kinase [Actinomycetota bacterium]